MTLATVDPVQTEERQNFADLSRSGKFHDLVTRYGLDPTVAVFTREAPPAEDAPLGKLLKSLDDNVQKFIDAARGLEAFSDPEVAQLLGVALGTVKTRLELGLKKIYDGLKELKDEL